MKIQLKARNRAHQYEAAPGETILGAGLARGIGLPYECASGTCGTCRARLLEGEIRDAWPAAPGRKSCKSGDEFLMCQCAAAGDLAVEVTGFVDTLDPAVCVPQGSGGRIAAIRALTHDVAEIDIDLPRPIDFDAGQFMLVRVQGIAGSRGWSMVNYERGARHLRFVVKKKPGGALSEWLFSGDRSGTTVELFGPLGRATFYPDLGKNLLCIAGGSGIAGMMSILERAAGADYFKRHDGNVFFGVRTMRDAFYLREFEALRKRCGERLSVVIALSEEQPGAAAAAEFPLLGFDTGFVHDVAKRRMEGRLQGVRAYLAGPPPAVDASVRLLLMARLPASDIRYDKFS